MFEKIKYDSYPWNAIFGDLPIEYEQRLFTKLPIYSLTDNLVEKLRCSLIKRSVYNKIYESNSQNSDFDEKPFDGDERLIARRRISRINDDIVFRLKNGSSVDL